MSPLRRFAVLSLCLSFAVSLAAQCEPQWSRAFGSPGMASSSDTVRCFAEAPNGDLYVGGWFTLEAEPINGSPTQASRIARWDGEAWHALGAGTQTIMAIAVHPNGDVFAGGNFASIDGTPASGIARWDGTSWYALGSGLTANAAVYSLAILPNGDVVAAGSFTTAGGQLVNHVARWDGNSWHSMAGGANHSIYDLLVLPGGDLIACGQFTAIGGVAAQFLARWNGASWSAVTTLPFSGNRLDSVERLANGDLLVGGSFSTIGGVPFSNVARWTGSAWFSLGSGLSWSNGHDFAQTANGDIIAVGGFTQAGGNPVNHVARWDGTAWHAMGSGASHSCNAVHAHSNGDVFVGGGFNQVGGVHTNCIARWRGGEWQPLRSGVGSQHYGSSVAEVANATIWLPDGDLVAAGGFTEAGGRPASRIARWDGERWYPLGAGLDGAVEALARDGAGYVYAGGVFSNAGGAPASRVARWDGAAWSPLGAGCNGTVLSLLVLSDGDLIAAGEFTTAGGVPAARIARWDGTTWHPLGAGMNFAVHALAQLPNGDVVAGGVFTQAGGVACEYLARWDGTVWIPIAGLTEPGYQSFVRALAIDANGHLVVGALFGVGVKRWDGSAWHYYGTGTNSTVSALAPLPNGDLIAGGWHGLAPANRILRWNGTAWTAFGEGASDEVLGMSVAFDGRVAVAGEFRHMAGVPSRGVAILEPTCPATAIPFGSGCAGNTLTALQAPWVESTFRARGSGLPTTAIVLHATSVTAIAPGLPLGLVFAPALPGCDALVVPDILGAGVTLDGTFTSELFLPNTPPLVGVTFFHQQIAVGLDSLGAWQTVTATNALQLSAGAL